MILDYHGPKTGATYAQHLNAVHDHKSNSSGVSLAAILRGWESYAATHEASYGDAIGTDCVLGPAWAAAGLAIKRLLDGDCGGLDCGSVARNILAALDAQGFRHDGFTLLADE